ncbi:TRAP transporter small permease [Elioraea rosea]|uniref:TRAP transporter small permease n=1 Tax=Elioraea rosea TaxID=2492390 RepID=UPI001181D014|nr:TRAP transporter small permease [Elioraea rosea]
MLRALRLFEGFAGLVARVAATLGAVAGLVCFALVCASVGWRYFLGQPQPWIDHAAAWLVVALVMLAAAETQRREEHIGVEVVTNRLRGGARRAARILSVLSVLAVAAILLREGIETVSFSRMIGIATNIEAVPLWWLHLLIPIGAALLLLVSLAQLLVLLAGGEPRGSAPRDEAGLTAASGSGE